MSGAASGRSGAAESPAELDLGAAPDTEARRDKAPGAFRTISEVSEELDIPAHVLRFWETKFPHLAPMKRGGGRRYYRPADMSLLRGIRTLLHDEGLTIKGLQKVFRERGPRHVAMIGDGEAPVVGEPPDGPDGEPETAGAVEAPAVAMDARFGAALGPVIARLERARASLAG